MKRRCESKLAKSGSRRIAPRALLVALIVVWPVLLQEGCGVLRWAYAPERSSRHTIIQTSGAAAEGDIVLAQPEVAPDTASSEAHAPPARRREPASRPPTRPVAQAPDTSAAEKVEEPASPAPPISVVLPEAEKRQLIKSTRKELDEAVTILRRVGGRLDSPEAIEKKQTVQGLIDRSRDALERDDVRAAANLARRARILAIELLSLR